MEDVALETISPRPPELSLRGRRPPRLTQRPSHASSHGRRDGTTRICSEMEERKERVVDGLSVGNEHQEHAFIERVGFTYHSTNHNSMLLENTSSTYHSYQPQLKAFRKPQLYLPLLPTTIKSILNFIFYFINTNRRNRERNYFAIRFPMPKNYCK